MIYLLAVLLIIFLVISIFISKKALKKGKKIGKVLFVQACSFTLAFIACSLISVSISHAAGESTQTAASQSNSLGLLAAALASGLGCIGSGIAVAATAPAAVGALAEDPKTYGKSLVFVALGEGMVVFGFIVSLMILGKI